MNLLNEHFRPRATFLPLLLGILVLCTTNALWLEFGIHPRAGVVALSFTAGLIVFSDRSIPFFKAILYFFLMSSMIFLIAIGTQRIVQLCTASKGSPLSQWFSGVPAATSKDAQYRRFFQPW